ncbi:MAG: hypothetical protein AB8G11_09620 [Saprospiraceae bacterium]
MKFTQNEKFNKYNDVSKQDLIDFNKREIMFLSTLSSCLGSENAVLTLENEKIFYVKMNGFFDRLKESKKISEYSLERKCTLFYKWLQNFLNENSNNKQIKYVSEKTLLNELKEASIILTLQELKERNLI